MQLIAAGFARESAAAAKLDRDWKEGGLLILSDEMKNKIKSSGGMGNVSVIQKFQDMCAYQMELGYDLAINPCNNVSQNPGYESVLGVTCG